MSALQRLAALLPGQHLRLLAAVVLVSMIASSAEFVILVSRENDLVDRFSDSTWWTAAKFDDEIQMLHISFAGYDGTPDALAELRNRYDIAYSRIGTLEDAQLEPRPDAPFVAAFARVRQGILALEPRVAALRPGDVAPVRALTADIMRLEADTGHMTTLGAQEDAAHREALRAAVRRANAAFAVTSALLIGSLLLALRAVMRQAVVLDRGRRRSEALSAELSVALAQAQAGARAKSAFLATISHEVRTPMNGVLGAASLLALTRLSDMQRRWVAIVRACGEALLAQLDDVLDFSALEADAIVVQHEVLDIRALAEATARMAEGTAGQKGLDLVVAVDPDVPREVVTDRRRLGQILLNLVVNATKFTEAGGVAVRVALRRRGGRAWLRVAVIDTGPGVPRAERGRIFAEFTRLERPAERDARGTGLGLAIGRRVVAALGGTLNVADAVGGGSVFWLLIPVELPPNAEAPAIPPACGTAAVIGGAPPVRRALELLLRGEGYRCVPPTERDVTVLLVHGARSMVDLPAAQQTLRFGAGCPLDGTLTAETLRAALTGGAMPVTAAAPLDLPVRPAAPLRLLVADDDPINREIETSLLRHLGHVVFVASDGALALATARTQPFDCILLDLHMPGLNGAELARTLRHLPGPIAATRLVAVTADVDAEAHTALMRAGFDAIVTKPVTLERLAAALPTGDPASQAAAPAPPPNATPKMAPGMAPEMAIDTGTRALLAARLAPERFAALVRTFWEEMLRTLEQPGGFPGPGTDRRLHSLAGSSASLGYLAVAAAARRSRGRLAAGDDPADLLADLHQALEQVLVADAGLLPDALADRLASHLAGSRQQAYRGHLPANTSLSAPPSPAEVTS